MTEDLVVDLNDETVAILENLCESLQIPKSGALILALQAQVAADNPDSSFKTVSGEDFLNATIDDFEKSPPTTKEDVADFIDKLRYAAQFMTTRQISNPYDKD